MLVIFCWCCQCYLGLFLIFIFMFLFLLFHLMTLILSPFNSWLVFFYLICTRSSSDTITVFNVMFRGGFSCVWLFVVYNFCWYFCLLCFHICSIILCLVVFSHCYIYNVVVFNGFFGFSVILIVDCFCDWWFYVCNWCCWFICFWFCNWCCWFLFYHLVFKKVI